MRLLLAILAASLLLAGCGSSSEPETAATETKPPVHMPGGVGITAGQTGTGTTSGASTGY